jgi:phosphatidylglycerophosphate synthase
MLRAEVGTWRANLASDTLDEMSERRKVTLGRAAFAVPNLMTVARACASPYAAKAFNRGRPRLGERILAAAMVTDILDGCVARQLNAETRLGAELDVLADILLLTEIATVLWKIPPVRAIGIVSIFGVALSELEVMPRVLHDNPQHMYQKLSLACVYAGSLLAISGDRRSRQTLVYSGAVLLGLAVPLAAVRITSTWLPDVIARR